MTNLKEREVAVGLTSKLYQISSKNHSKSREDSNPPGSHIYHYTTAGGLQGIVESNCLHASAAYFLNDSSEVAYGVTILDKVLEQWESDRLGVNSNLSGELVRDLRSKINGEGDREALVHSVYVACFCERDNVLSQWRTYGQAGGYSLGFPVVDGSIRGVTPEPPTYTALLQRVEYEREKQSQKCRRILDLILPMVDADANYSLMRNAKIPTYQGPTLLYDFVLSIMREMLLDEILAFKNEAFREENEWRLIVRPRLFLLQGRDDRGKTPTKRYFRPSRGIPIPFVKLVPLTGKLPIAQIRSGPSIDLGRARSAVRLLMRENGFPDFVFEGSEIPVLLGPP